MRKRNITSKIREAFASVPMPAPENLMEIGAAAITNDPGTDAQYVAYAFAGKRWQDLTAEELRTGHAALGLMTWEGVHYYLPAFLIQTLENPVEMDVEVNQTLWYLSPPPFGFDETLDVFELKLARLTSPQRAAIGWFFAYLNSHLDKYGLWSDETEAPLTTYWQSG